MSDSDGVDFARPSLVQFGARQDILRPKSSRGAKALARIYMDYISLF